MDRRRFLRGGVPVALVVLAGCSGGEGTPTGETASATESPTATAGASPSATDGSGGGATGTSTDASTATDGDGPTGSSPTGSSTPTEAQTATDGPTATDEPTTTPAATESPTTTPSSDREVVVGPNGTLTFQPQSFTISAGETVLWRWESGGHNVSPTEGEQPSGADWPGKDESTYPAGTTYSYTFDVPGDYAYHCDPHQSVGMVGSFTVE